MTEIKYEIIKKIGVLSSPLLPSPFRDDAALPPNPTPDDLFAYMFPVVNRGITQS